MRIWVGISGLSGAMAVALAAYATHGGTGDQVAFEMAKTASQYQLIHALALLAADRLQARLAALLFTVGLVLFPITLYLIAFGVELPFKGTAPVGGTAFILGWLALGFAGLRK